MKLKVTVNQTEYEIDVEVEKETPSLPPIVIGGSGGAVPASAPSVSHSASANAVVAPLAGSVARILVAEGDEVEAGQVLLVLEAMKMETEITAPAAGTVSAILVKPGEMYCERTLLGICK